MELLKEFTEKNLGISQQKIDFDLGYKVRHAARAVVIDKNGKLPLLFDAKHNNHKIPGGGVDRGETIKQALKRETREEAGCNIKVIDEIGLIIEYRNGYKILQISYCWLARVEGKIIEPQFDEEELSEGFSLKWINNIDEAIRLLKKDKPREYSGPFMRARDLLFLQKAKELIGKNKNNNYDQSNNF